MKKVFIITGEHSGDIHAAKVVQELKIQNPDVEIEGIGGENLKNAGVKLFSGHEKMSAMGFSPKIIIDHLTLGKRVVSYIKDKFKPDLVLLIDYGAFNLNIAKAIKIAKIQAKVFYYIPPQIWASRKWRINTIKKYVDKVLCIFPFEEPLYKENEVDVKYCGHPLTSQLPEKADRNEFCKKHGLDSNKKIVSVFPGSRVFELKQLMNTFMKAAKELQTKYPEVQFIVSQAPNLSDKVYQGYLKTTDFKIIKGENHAMLSISDSLILASGTVALEAALYQTPMIIAYRGPWLLYFIYRIVRCLDMASLPNIIADKRIVPELLQSDLTVKNIVKKTECNLFDEPYRNDFINALEDVKALMSDKKSSREVADAISEALN